MRSINCVLIKHPTNTYFKTYSTIERRIQSSQPKTQIPQTSSQTKNLLLPFGTSRFFQMGTQTHFKNKIDFKIFSHSFSHSFHRDFNVYKQSRGFILTKLNASTRFYFVGALCSYFLFPSRIRNSC